MSDTPRRTLDLFPAHGADPEIALGICSRLGIAAAHDRPDALHLVLDAAGLALDDGSPGGPVRADLVAAAAQRGHRDAPLARAVGIERGVRRVVDATAGLGRDAAALAAAGATVTLLERDPVLAALLADGLARAARDAPQLAARLTLVATDALAWLAARRREAGAIEAVLIDPMFPDRGKAALPRRDLQLFRALLGPGDPADSVALLTAARRVATRRVVVKRPPHAAPLAPGAIATIAAPRVRFDVYAPAS